MAIEVVEASGDDLDRWDSYLDRAPRPSPFHRRALLELVAAQSGGELRPLIGYKGQEPIGLAPVFVSTAGPFTMVRSPPPGLQIGFMGPILLDQAGSKQRRLEKNNERFIDSCLEWIDREIDPDMEYYRCADQYDDVRPFMWNGNDYEIEPEYTYVVDLTRGEDELFRSFSKEVRRSVRTARDAGCEIRPAEDASEVERVVTHYLERHSRDGSAADFDLEFAMDVYDRLDSSLTSTHVCFVDGEYVGGTLNLHGGDTIYGWLGGAAPEVDLPINDLLYWNEMVAGIERGFQRIDFLGAMKRSLCAFKSKFNPDLQPRFTVRRTSPRMNVATGVYNRLPKALRPSIGHG